ncbi:MAG: hypothetical protein IPG04_34985 [Polyangiaceae bacterium]|nr:hypothetical protein [Polyangiaceae bacterium]
MSGGASDEAPETLLYDGASWDLALEGARGEGSRPPFDTVDVSRLPGARIVALARFEHEGASIVAGCAAGPSDRFAPGLEAVLFDRATGLAWSSLAIVPRDVAIEREGALARSYERRTVGRSDRGEVVLEQLLAFDGRDLDLVLCSAACVGPRCGEVSLVVRGELPEPPPPNVAVRALFYAAEHPAPVLGAAGAVLLAVVALVLWRRPSPRP